MADIAVIFHWPPSEMGHGRAFAEYHHHCGYAREKAERDAEYQALKEELDRQLELAHALQANMNIPARQAKLSQHERDLAARSQSPIDVTKMPKRPLAKLRRREARMRNKQD